MSRAYVLDPTTRDVLGLVDQSWEKLTYTRRYWGMDTFTMTIQRARLYASTLVKGRLLYLPDEGDRIFLIEQIQSVQEGSRANDLMTVSGRSMEGPGMAERLVIPPAGQDYDKQTAVPGETAMKHYVTDHASETATTVARRISGLTCVASAGTGANVTVAGRYQYVFDIVKQIGLLTGQGWEIVYNPSTDKFEFDVINGVDRHASVFFDFAFETLERWEELDSLVDSKTVAVVAGQGEGKDRDIRTRWSGTEPTGLARREAFIDARDVDLGSTTELDARGDAFIAAAKGETRLEAGIHQYGSFKYGVHWDMGDLVLIRNEERGIEYTARVVEVSKSFDRSSAAPTVVAVIDRPFPTLKEQVAGAGAGAGAVDYPDTLNPKLDTITLSRLNPDIVLSRTGTEALQVADASAGDLAGGVTVKGFVRARRPSASNGSFAARLDADTVDRLLITADGELLFSDGAAAADTNLHRAAANILRSDDAIRSRRAATTDEAFGTHESASGTLRWQVDAAGKMQWAATSSSFDTNLYRSAANVLATDDSLLVVGDLFVGASTGAGNSADGVKIDAGGSIELRSANPFIDFKAADIDFGARIIYDFDVADNLEFRGAAAYDFDGPVNTGDLTPTGLAGSTVASGSGTVTIAGDGTATFSAQTFEWRKYGRLVIMRVNVTVSANGSGTATVTFTFPGAPTPATTSRVLIDRGGTGVNGIICRLVTSGSNPQFSQMHTVSAFGLIDGAALVSGAGYNGSFAYMASS